jgi:hypothetical protein
MHRAEGDDGESDSVDGLMDELEAFLLSDADDHDATSAEGDDDDDYDAETRKDGRAADDDWADLLSGGRDASAFLGARSGSTDVGHGLLGGDGGLEAALSGAAMEATRRPRTDRERRAIRLGRAVAEAVAQGLPGAGQFARIVRQPLRRGKHVILDVCTPLGSMVRWVPSKRKLQQAHPGAYRAARKASWGGWWPNWIARKDMPSGEMKRCHDCRGLSDKDRESAIGHSAVEACPECTGAFGVYLIDYWLLLIGFLSLQNLRWRRSSCVSLPVRSA